jgi:hypothetical protein
MSSIFRAAEGTYERHPVENDFHRVTLRAKGGDLRWCNAAGVSWLLRWVGPGATAHVYCARTGSDCPYGERDVEVLADGSGRVTGVRFGDLYSRTGGLEQRAPRAEAFLASKDLEWDALTPLGLEALEAFLAASEHYQVCSRWSCSAVTETIVLHTVACQVSGSPHEGRLLQPEKPVHLWFASGGIAMRNHLCPELLGCSRHHARVRPGALRPRARSWTPSGPPTRPGQTNGGPPRPQSTGLISATQPATPPSP